MEKVEEEELRRFFAPVAEGFRVWSRDPGLPHHGREASEPWHGRCNFGLSSPIPGLLFTEPPSMKKQLFLLAAALLPHSLAPAAAFAQVDITVQAGYRWGGLETERDIVCVASIDFPCEAYAETDDDSFFGLTVGFPVGSGWAIEAHASRQETDLLYSNPVALVLAAPYDATITALEGDLVRRFELGKWEPFAGAGIGVVRYEADPVLLFDFDKEDRLAANLVGGARFAFNENFGLRLEGRARWISLPDEIEGDEVMLESSVGFSFRL
jgi:hypothetical protein